MPDFDRFGNPIIKPVGNKPFDLTNPASKPAPLPYVGRSMFNANTNVPQEDGEDVFDLLERTSRKGTPGKGILITNKELEQNKRYDYYNPTIDNYEDFAAHGQSAIEQARNGVLKGVNLAATTVAGGFAMLGGAAKAALVSHKLSDIWDNEGTRGIRCLEY
jgi:hypothetical protein